MGIERGTAFVINDQGDCVLWVQGDAYDVEVVDYH